MEHAAGAVTALVVVIFLAACFAFVISFSLTLGFYGAKYLSDRKARALILRLHDDCSIVGYYRAIYADDEKMSGLIEKVREACVAAHGNKWGLK